jgi:SNF2 family DNA or RNA helicase
MLNIIEDYLNLRNLTYERIDGEITGKKRQSAMDRYICIDVFMHMTKFIY